MIIRVRFMMTLLLLHNLLYSILFLADDLHKHCCAILIFHTMIPSTNSALLAAPLPPPETHLRLSCGRFGKLLVLETDDGGPYSLMSKVSLHLHLMNDNNNKNKNNMNMNKNKNNNNNCNPLGTCQPPASPTNSTVAR